MMLSTASMVERKAEAGGTRLERGQASKRLQSNFACNASICQFIWPMVDAMHLDSRWSRENVSACVDVEEIERERESGIEPSEQTNCKSIWSRDVLCSRFQISSFASPFQFPLSYHPSLFPGD